MDWFYITNPATKSVTTMSTSISQSESDDCVEVVIQSPSLCTSNKMKSSIAMPRHQTPQPSTFSRKPLAVASPLALSLIAHNGNTSSSSSASNILKNVLPNYRSGIRRQYQLKRDSTQIAGKENEIPSIWRDGYAGNSKRKHFNLADTEVTEYCKENFTEDEDSLSVSTTSGVSDGIEKQFNGGIRNQPLHPLQQSPNHRLKFRQTFSERKSNTQMNTFDFSTDINCNKRRHSHSTKPRSIDLLPRIAAANFQQQLKADSSIESSSQSVAIPDKIVAMQKRSTSKRRTWKHTNNYAAPPMTPRRQSLAQKCLFDALESMQSRSCSSSGRNSVLLEVDGTVPLDTLQPGITSPTSYIGTIIDFECHQTKQSSIVEGYHSDNDKMPHFHNSVSLSCDEGSYVGEFDANLIKRIAGDCGDPPQNETSLTAHEALALPQSDSCTSSLTHSGSVEEGYDDQPNEIGIDDDVSVQVQMTMSKESMDSQCTADERRDKVSPLAGVATSSSHNSPAARSSVSSFATSTATSSATSAASDLFSLLRKQNLSADDTEGDSSKISSMPNEEQMKPTPTLETNNLGSPSERYLLSSQTSSYGNHPCEEGTSVTKSLNVEERRDVSMPKHLDTKSNSRFSFLANALVATKFLKSPSPHGNSTPEETLVCKSDSSTPKATGRSSPGKRCHHYLEHDSSAMNKRRNKAQKTGPQSMSFERENLSLCTCATSSNMNSEIKRQVDNKKNKSLFPNKCLLSSVSTTGFHFAETLDISSLASRSYDETLLTRDEVARLSDRVRMLEERLPGVGEDAEEMTKLRDHVNCLEDELRASKESNKDLEEKLDEIFHVLEEETSLKESAQQKAYDLTNEIESLKKTKIGVEESLRQRIECLEAQLMETKRVNTDYEDMKKELTTKNNELDVLQKLNSKLSEILGEIESELSSSKKENETLRENLLALTEKSNIKEKTLSAALAELKALSEKHFETQEELRNERELRQDEVSSLQFSIDDISTEMLKMSQETHDLECENHALKLELRKMRTENESSKSMRAAPGF